MVIYYGTLPLYKILIDMKPEHKLICRINKIDTLVTSTIPCEQDSNARCEGISDGWRITIHCCTISNISVLWYIGSWTV